MTTLKIKFVRPAALRNEKLIKAALAEPKTIYEIAEIIHIQPESARRYLVALKDRKEIYVSRFKEAIRSNGKPYPQPMYALGNHRDAVFKAPTRIERSKIYMEKIRRDPDRYDRYKAKDRARHRKAKPQPELQYFFGKVGA